MGWIQKWVERVNPNARLQNRIDALTAEADSLRAQMEGLGDQLKNAIREIALEKSRLETAQGIDRTMLQSAVDSLEIHKKTLTAQYNRLGEAIAITTRDLQLAQQELFRREHPGATEEDVQRYAERVSREIVLNEYEKNAGEQISRIYEELQQTLYPDAEDVDCEYDAARAAVVPEDAALAGAVAPPEPRFQCSMPEKLVSRALPVSAEDESIAPIAEQA